MVYCKFAIRGLYYAGNMPKRIVSLVLEWAFEHRQELMEDWELAKRREQLKSIKPLV